MTFRQQSHVNTELEAVNSRPGSSPRLSVILCTYNRRNLVLSALASLRRQTLSYDQFEVIVVDNGSTDGTLTAVRTYVSAGVHFDRKPEDTWRVFCLSEPHNGLAHARHTGLLAASGEVAVFIDDDTLADPHFLARLLKAYEETNADALGGRVELRWEGPRPHWLTDDLLDMLGYFAPTTSRTHLQAGTSLKDFSFSSSNFSVKIEALRNIGYFSPFLSKRLHLPASVEVDDLCNRLNQAGYKLWYEPDAVITHRVPPARLKRPFFVGRAYWQGRSEVLMRYVATLQDGDSRRHTTWPILRTISQELRDIAYLALVQRPLLRLAGKSSNERLLAAMEQARRWGHLRQQLQFLERAPVELTTPAVLLVRPTDPDPTAELLARSLTLQDVSCTTGTSDIPVSWLWRHRAYQQQCMGIVHFYRPGALNLTHRQRQHLWLQLWLARRWGIGIVTTDTGGWWQSTHHLSSLSRRTLERKLMHLSDIVLAYTRQPEQLYLNKKLRHRLCCLPHPGFRGYYQEPMPRAQAHKQLGLPLEAGFVYLCFANTHTERELIFLIETFADITNDKEEQPLYTQHERLPEYSRGDPRGRPGSSSSRPGSSSSRPGSSSSRPGSSPSQGTPQLLIVGSPQDKKRPMRILKLAALHSAIHLCMTPPCKEEIPLYIGALDAVVLPHFALRSAGLLETALLALSYERVVIAPNLPRFRGMLPPHASLLYEPSSRKSLAQALLKAQTLDYHMGEKEAIALEAASGWGQYAYRLLKIYKQLLNDR